MSSFESDYIQGAHPEILNKLIEIEKGEAKVW